MTIYTPHTERNTHQPLAMCARRTGLESWAREKEAHLGVVEAEDKVKHVGELLGQGLLVAKALPGRFLAEGEEQLGEALL